MGLLVRHLAGRPDILTLPCAKVQGNQKEEKGKYSFHVIDVFKSYKYSNNNFCIHQNSSPGVYCG